MKSRVRRTAVVLASLAAAGVAATIVAALVPVWPCALFEHFRFQYVIVGIAVIALCAGLRVRGWFDVAVVATLTHSLWLVPDLAQSPRAAGNGVAVRVLMLNVHTSSSRFEDVRRLIRDLQPDVIGLLEVDPRWLAELAPAVADYSHRLERPRDDNFGVALYAKASMSGTIEELGSTLPTVIATIDVQGVALGIVLTHPLPPVNSKALDDMFDQFDAIATRAYALPDRKLIMGDFNATPWSRPFRRLRTTTGLCDSRAGFGYQATFPVWSAVLRIPIDHVLVSCSLGVRARWIERDVGSDHFPVVVDLVVR